MSYLHIDNLYKDQRIMMFKECYAMEKIHGTSAHITYNDGEVKFFAGGGNYEAFVKLFDVGALKERFSEVMTNDLTVIVYGESYGGKQQGMSKVYGKDPRFIAFEVKIGDLWLNVPKAHAFVDGLGLEFVHYEKIPTTLEAIDAQRDALSVQASRNDMGEHPREGIVLRPIEEFTMNNGRRVVVKHKTDAYKETKTPRAVTDEELKILTDAKAIADEWVTYERLNHVLTGNNIPLELESIGKIIPLMIEDIEREAEGEIVTSSQAKKEIGKATALMIKSQLQGRIKRSVL